jgi:hypothetical protein
MGWSFRKSKSFGPFQLNFSKSGIGLSTGIKGARISTNSRGTYVNLGMNGMYYRKRISQKSSNYTPSFVQQPSRESSNEAMDNELMNSLTDTDSQAFINELESKDKKVSFLKIFATSTIFGYFIFITTKSQVIVAQPVWAVIAVTVLALIIAGSMYLSKLDKQRMTMHLHYTMDGELKSLYDKFLLYFEKFAESEKIWQQLSAQEVTDTRRNAGASLTITRNPIKAWSNNRLPSPHLITNVSVPFIQLHDRQLYFFPERIIFKKGTQLGGVHYKHINIIYADTKFIENETPAQDAQIVDHTWEYVNKKGDPDRRFTANRRLPICLYSQYTFTSTQGWKEVLLTSKLGAMDQLAEFINVIAEHQRNLKQ